MQVMLLGRQCLYGIMRSWILFLLYTLDIIQLGGGGGGIGGNRERWGRGTGFDTGEEGGIVGHPLIRKQYLLPMF